VAYLYTDVVRYATDVKTALIIPEAYREHHLPEAISKLPENWKQIEISNLSFTHHRHPEFVPGNSQVYKNITGLDNINIKLQRGKRIALVGESGSGKSTLLAVLRGLYPPEQNAMIKTDGMVQEDGINTLSDHVTLFPQEPEIFENTIEYNITLGLPYEADEIDRICRIVHFSEVVDQLPKGLQSNIVEKGVNLSGGQKQRLALARGLFAAKDSDIILLDEPTSSVDPKTELKIYEQLFTEFADKVIVSALHRLHLLKQFDYIYVLQNGAIADEGSLYELLDRSEVFRELWKHQELVKRE
jgi:ABC-type multidrug transport system fused ATPase/permease subunit